MLEYEDAVSRVQKLIDMRPKEVPAEYAAAEYHIKRELNSTIAFIRKCEAAERYDKETISSLRNMIKRLDKFLEGLNFRRLKGGYSVAITHKHVKKCKCGKTPLIKYYLEEQTWYMACDCGLQTDTYTGIKDAMVAWQNGEFTEASVMLQNPLTIENVDNDGLMDLAKKVCEVAAEDYIDGSKGMKESLKSFFRTSPLMLGADGDAAIKKLDEISEEKRKKQMEKEVATA